MKATKKPYQHHGMLGIQTVMNHRHQRADRFGEESNGGSESQTKPRKIGIVADDSQHFLVRLTLFGLLWRCHLSHRRHRLMTPHHLRLDSTGQAAVFGHSHVFETNRQKSFYRFRFHTRSARDGGLYRTKNLMIQDSILRGVRWQPGGPLGSNCRFRKGRNGTFSERFLPSGFGYFCRRFFA